MGTRYFNSSDGILLPQKFNERGLSQNGLVFLTKPEVRKEAIPMSTAT